MNTLSFIVGMASGALIVGMVASFGATDNQVLHEVGIERIEKCHNVHSNWYEIVWKEVK